MMPNSHLLVGILLWFRIDSLVIKILGNNLLSHLPAGHVLPCYEKARFFE